MSPRSVVLAVLAVLLVPSLAWAQIPGTYQELPAPESSALRTRLFEDVHELLGRTDRPIHDIALGDVDGDGDLDAFLARGEYFFSYPVPAPNGLLLNDGTARFDPADARLPAEAEVTFAARLEDVEGDGDLDLLALDLGLGVRLYVNDGEGSFAEAPGVLPPLDDFAFELADVDGDGDLDLYVLSPTQDLLYLQDAPLGFVDESFRLPADPLPTGSAAFGDLDGDGALDLLLGGPAGSTARLHLNKGDGSFISASELLPSADGAPFQLADVDGDGDLDALTPFVLYRNEGAARFSDASDLLPSLGSFATGFFLADVEGDGDVDLLGTARILYLNDGRGKFSDERELLPGPDIWQPKALGDLDGDGDLDVLTAWLTMDWANRVIRESRLLLGDGTGLVDVEPRIEDLPLRPEAHRGKARSCALADVDDDGDLDALTGAPIDDPGGSWEQKTFLFLNDGWGRFQDRSERLPWIPGIVHDLAVADLDGDGDVDVARGESSNWDGGGGGVVFHFNHGSAGFDDGRTIPWSNSSTTVIDLGDVDRDGDIDVLAGQDSGIPVFSDELFLNDGHGSFVRAPGFAGGSQATVEARLVDLDQDGDLDALLAGSGAYLFLNDGHAAFSDASATLPFVNAIALDLADVDGDGDTDLLHVAGERFSRRHRVRLYGNDGSGLLVESTARFAPDDVEIAGVRLADVGEDGAPEAFVERVGERTRLHENRGDGVFRPLLGALPEGLPAAGAFGDVDGDGDADLLADGRLWTNLARQVRWRTLPRIGQPLRVSVHGPPGAPFLLLSAPDVGPLAGVRRHVHVLDPALLTIVASGTLRGGTADVVRAVPDDPALVGTSTCWQALVGQPGRWTHVEWITLSGL